jgi:phosphatidylglycerophosphate synthase
LWAASAVIAAQYVTDAIDGKVGVLRGAGLVRWGFYMDHFLDYVFLCSILLGYGLLVPDRFQWLMTALVAIAGAFMASSFLACTVTGELGISYVKVGPIEIRLVFMAVNAWLATVGRASLTAVLPSILLLAGAVLSAMVYQIQRRFRELDEDGRQAYPHERSA